MPGRNQRGWRRRTPGRAAPAPPIDAETARLLERIAEIARNARATWFILLGALAFAGVTLLGVEDADFFAYGRQTMLPLVGVEIPTRSFFFTAPLLVAALYGYFHFQLRELWRALAPDAIETEIGARRLADVVHPGLITGWGLRQRHDHRERRSALDRLQGAVVVTLVWGAAPLVLVGLWWRAMPAHEEWLTLAGAAALGLVLFIGRGTWVEAKRTLRGRQPGRRLGAVLCTMGLVGWVTVAFALGYVSWRRTEGGLDHYADWAAERWNATVGERVLTYDEDDAAWRGEEHPRVASWINWFRGAKARFVDDDMRWYAPSRLDALAPVDLEGVALVPRPADWRSHEVARDAFRDAWCDRKDHGRTACADFIAEREDAFEAAWEAERAATLNNLPRLLRDGADLVGARLAGAVLDAAEFTGTGLNQGQIDGAIGDADTVLPRDAETGAQLYVWSCWEQPPPTLDRTLAPYPESYHQELRDLWLCKGRPREKVGRPATEPEEAPGNGSGAATTPSP